MFGQAKLLHWLATLSFIGVCLTYLVIGVGVFTRLSNAGLGCPDWPACYGHLVVPKHTAIINQINAQYPNAPFAAEKAKIEMAHRYIAGLLGVFIIVIAFLCAFSARQLGFRFTTFSLALFVLLIYQVLLGMWTVTLKLSPPFVMQHLMVALIILSLLWLINLNTRAKSMTTMEKISSIIFQPKIKKIRWLAAITLIFLFLQIILGAWTSSHYMGLIYSGFSAVHRWGALVVGCMLLFLFLSIQMDKSSHQHIKKISRWLLFFLCVQVMLGGANVIFQLPLFIAIAHNLIAATLLLIMVTINYQLSV